MKTGWLSPCGDFTECGCYEHLKAADKIVELFGYATFFNDRINDSDDTLMYYGWAYIGKSSIDHTYRVGWERFLTEQQKAFLAPYFEEAVPMDEFSRYRYESETDVYTT